MSEIEKMYENVGIEPTHYDACTLEDKYWKDGSMQNLYGTFDSYLSFECPYYGEGCYSTCEYAYDKDEYPPFTAEKQIAILQLLTQQCDLTISHFTEWEFIHYDGQEPTQVTGEDFAETFAKLINAYWQSLTEEEKQQVKGILE